MPEIDIKYAVAVFAQLNQSVHLFVISGSASPRHDARGQGGVDPAFLLSSEQDNSIEEQGG